MEEAARLLGLTRQAIWGFGKGKFYPRSEVLRLLVEHGLKLKMDQFTVTAGAFPPLRSVSDQPEAIQLPLGGVEEALKTVKLSDLTITAVLPKGNALEVSLKIAIPANPQGRLAS